MPLKLYKIDLSPPARAAMMVCDLLGLEVDMVDLNFKEMEHRSPAYLKKNPLHTIPVLEDTENDIFLHDSHAMMMYLVDMYGKTDDLYPKDVKQRALVNQKLFFDDSILFPRLRSVTYAALVEGVRNPSKRQLQDLEEAYGFLEEFLSRSKYLTGDQLTIADIAAVATITGYDLIIPIEPKKYPKINNWLREMEKETFYQKCNVPGTAAFGKALKETLDI